MEQLELEGFSGEIFEIWVLTPVKSMGMLIFNILTQINNILLNTS